MKEVRFNYIIYSFSLSVFVLALICFPNFEVIPHGELLAFLTFFYYFSLLLILDLITDHPLLKRLSQFLLLIFSFYYFLDQFSIYRANYSFHELVHMTFLGGDVITTLNEIGIKKWHLLIVASFLGGLSYLGLRFIKWNQSIFCNLYFDKKKILSFLILGNSLLFIEQLSLHNDLYFLRSRYISFYPQIKQTPSLTINRTKSLTEDDLKNIINQSSLAVNPKNIILIILEGVPGSLVTEKTAPNLNEFKKDSDVYTKSKTEAIATHLALNQLLFKSSALNFEQDIISSKKISYAAIPLEILKKSQYEIYMGISTDFKMKNDAQRALGTRHTIDVYNNSYSHLSDKRNLNDNSTKEQFLNWLKSRKDNRSFVAVLQLDSTHWPYEFDSQHTLFNPFLLQDTLDKFDTPEKTELVLNRYKNSLRQVDSNIGAILKNLKEKKIYDDSIIVIVSDHGENFKKGFVTHLNLSNESKDILLLTHFPKTNPEKINSFVSHRDIWQLIFKNIDLKSDHFQVRNTQKDSLFTANPNLELGELEIADKIIHFKISHADNTLTFTPYLVTDRNRMIQENGLAQLNLVQLKNELEEAITF